jgi:hypothetical protein
MEHIHVSGAMKTVGSLHAQVEEQVLAAALAVQYCLVSAWYRWSLCVEAEEAETKLLLVLHASVSIELMQVAAHDWMYVLGDWEYLRWRFHSSRFEYGGASYARNSHCQTEHSIDIGLIRWEGCFLDPSPLLNVLSIWL